MSIPTPIFLRLTFSNPGPDLDSDKRERSRGFRKKAIAKVGTWITAVGRIDGRKQYVSSRSRGGLRQDSNRTSYRNAGQQFVAVTSCEYLDNKRTWFVCTRWWISEQEQVKTQNPKNGKCSFKIFTCSMRKN